MVKCSFQGVLLDDAKVGELSGKASPTGLDFVHTGRTGSLLSPTVKFADTELFAFGEQFHGAVGTILDPSGQSEPPRLPLGSRSKVDALDPASDL